MDFKIKYLDTKTMQFVSEKSENTIESIYFGKKDINGNEINQYHVIECKWNQGETTKEVVQWDESKCGFWPFCYFEGNMCNSLEDDYVLQNEIKIVGIALDLVREKFDIH